jgi:small subunit ribosomal protein S13
MARIAGVDLPREKAIRVALTYIYGIGNSSAARICDEASVAPNTKTFDLDES